MQTLGVIFTLEWKQNKNVYHLPHPPKPFEKVITHKEHTISHASRNSGLNSSISIPKIP